MRVPALILSLCAAAFGQPSPRRTFEVASIRAREGPYGRIGVYTAGQRLNAEATPVRSLIIYAYGVRSFQVAQSPALAAAGDTPYDINAKAEGETPPTIAEFREMMRSLLADRFQLELHREMRQTPVYAMVAGINGPKLISSDPEPTGRTLTRTDGRNTIVTLPRATMDDLAYHLGNAGLDRPVIDRTGLTGTYAIKLTYTPEYRLARGEPEPNDVSIFTVIQSALGLRLVSQSAAFEYLVVDRVAKPTGN